MSQLRILSTGLKSLSQAFYIFHPKFFIYDFLLEKFQSHSPLTQLVSKQRQAKDRAGGDREGEDELEGEEDEDEDDEDDPDGDQSLADFREEKTKTPTPPLLIIY